MQNNHFSTLVKNKLILYSNINTLFEFLNTALKRFEIMNISTQIIKISCLVIYKYHTSKILCFKH